MNSEEITPEEYAAAVRQEALAARELDARRRRSESPLRIDQQIARALRYSVTTRAEVVSTESPLRIEKATKERVTVPIDYLFTGPHTTAPAVADRPKGIVVRSLHGRVEIADQSPISGSEALAVARKEWPELTFVRVLRAKDGTRVGDNDPIHAGETVVASDWEAPDA